LASHGVEDPSADARMQIGADLLTPRKSTNYGRLTAVDLFRIDEAVPAAGRVGTPSALTSIAVRAPRRGPSFTRGAPDPCRHPGPAGTAPGDVAHLAVVAACVLAAPSA